MAIDYQKLALRANQLLAENGQPMVLTKITHTDNGDGSFDSSETTHDGVGLVASITQADHAQFVELLATDAVIVCVFDEAPERGDRITANDRDWDIVQVNEVAPSGLVILHKIQVR